MEIEVIKTNNTSSLRLTNCGEVEKAEFPLDSDQINRLKALNFSSMVILGTDSNTFLELWADTTMLVGINSSLVFMAKLNGLFYDLIDQL